MTSTAWLNFVFSALISLQIVLCTSPYPEEQDAKTYTNDQYTLDDVTTNDFHHIFYPNIHESHHSNTDNQFAQYEMKKGEYEPSIHTNDYQSSVQDGSHSTESTINSDHTGSFLDDLFNYIRGDEQETSDVKKYNKRQFPSSMFNDDGRMDYGRGYSGQSSRFNYPGNNRVGGIGGYRGDSGQINEDNDYNDIYDDFHDDNDEDDEDIYSDNDEDEEETDDDDDGSDEEFEEDDEDSDDEEDEEDEIGETLVKAMRSSDDDIDDTVLEEIDENTLKAFSSFIDNLISDQLKTINESNESRSLSNENYSIDSQIYQPIVQENITSPFLSSIINNNNKNVKNTSNIGRRLENDMHAGSDSINEGRTARQVLPMDTNDNQMFVHVRNGENGQADNNEPEYDYRYQNAYDEFQKGHESVRGGSGIEEEFNYAYSFPKFQNLEKQYRTASADALPVVLMKVDNLDTYTTNAKHQVTPNDGGFQYPDYEPTQTKYKRDLEHVTNSEPQVIADQGDLRNTDNEENISTSTEESNDKEYIYESVSINSSPYYTVQSYPQEGQQISHVYKINDVIDNRDQIKDQIEMIPHTVISYLVENFLHKFPVNATNATAQDGVLINIYGDSTPPTTKQKRDLTSVTERNNEEDDECTKNAIYTLEDTIAYQLSQCVDLKNDSLTEVERRDLCKNIIMKVLANVSDENIVQQIIDNYDSLNSQNESENDQGTYCYGEANDDFDKTFINIKNLNIFYEFGESGQNCINVPQKRVQYTLPCGYPARRPVLVRNPYPNPNSQIQSNELYKDYNGIERSKNPHSSHQTDSYNTKHDDIKPLKESAKHHIDLPHNEDVDTTNKIAQKREDSHIQSATYEDQINAEDESDTVEDTSNSDSVYANHNLSTFEIEEQKPVVISNNILMDELQNTPQDSVKTTDSSPEESLPNLEKHSENIETDLAKEHSPEVSPSEDRIEVEEIHQTENPDDIVLIEEHNPEEVPSNITSSVLNVEPESITASGNNETTPDTSTYTDNITDNTNNTGSVDSEAPVTLEVQAIPEEPTSELLMEQTSTSNTPEETENTTDLVIEEENISEPYDTINKNDSLLIETEAVLDGNVQELEESDLPREAEHDSESNHNELTSDQVIYNNLDDTEGIEITGAVDSATEENDVVLEERVREHKDGSDNVADEVRIENIEESTLSSSGDNQLEHVEHYTEDNDKMQDKREVNSTITDKHVHTNMKYKSMVYKAENEKDSHSVKPSNVIENKGSHGEADEQNHEKGHETRIDNTDSSIDIDGNYDDDDIYCKPQYSNNESDTNDDNENRNSDLKKEEDKEEPHSSTKEAETMVTAVEQEKTLDDQGQRSKRKDETDVTENNEQELDEEDEYYEEYEDDDGDSEDEPEDNDVVDDDEGDDVNDVDDDDDDNDDDGNDDEDDDDKNDDDQYEDNEYVEDGDYKETDGDDEYYEDGEVPNEEYEEKEKRSDDPEEPKQDDGNDKINEGNPESTDQQETNEPEINKEPEDMTNNSNEEEDTNEYDEENDEEGPESREIEDNDSGEQDETEDQEYLDNNDNDTYDTDKDDDDYKDYNENDDGAEEYKDYDEDPDEEGDYYTDEEEPKNEDPEENGSHELEEEHYKEDEDVEQIRTAKSADEELYTGDITNHADYVRKCDVEKLILDILESKPHPDHDLRHSHMFPHRPDKKYKELVKDIASYFAKKNITSGDDICVYEEYGSKRGDDDVIILSGTKLYQNGIPKKDGQNYNLIIKKPHDSNIESYVPERKSYDDVKDDKLSLLKDNKYEKKVVSKDHRKHNTDKASGL